jgi:asparagine synthase (glutamine-hydrolysing)
VCGIAGIVDRKGVDQETLLSMRDSMVHRGPDDSGVWVSANGTVGLAHRRLAILDLSEAGRQPMSDTDRRIWVTYNGEIYNFQELRKELERHGYNFQSRTDTEVVINAYKKWNRNCLQRFNGMFAMAIYDSDQQQLFLARDRIGKKPLYYSQYSDKFVFASEMKALTRDKRFCRELDLQALNYYLTFGYIPGELTIFTTVRKLPPAHAMLYDLRTGEKEIWKYWDCPLPIDKTPNETELLEELQALLEDAIRLRMVSDVPLGAFLSGGIDSSIVVAMMSHLSKNPVKTFSIGFEQAEYNELSYAKIVANHFKTDHHEIIVKPDAFAILPKLVYQFDEPFADSSMLPTYYVSKASKEHATVAISGDGGDELFAGYSSYAATLGNYYTQKLMPSFARKGIAFGATYLPESVGVKRHLIRLGLDSYDSFIDRCTHANFKETHRRQLLNVDVLGTVKTGFLEPEQSRRNLVLKNYDFVNRLTYADFRTYLPDDILVKVDRASMFVSLEVRAPLLDYRIAEFSFAKVPGGLKIKGLATKYLLKKLAKKILPEKLNVNRKWGFVIPIAHWFRGSLSPQIKEILFDRKSHYFNQDYISKLLREHQGGIDHSGRLFTLLVFFLWEREYVRHDL